MMAMFVKQMPHESHAHAQNHQKHFFPVYLVAFTIIFKNNHRRNMQKNPARQRQEIRLPFGFKVFPKHHSQRRCRRKKRDSNPCRQLVFLFSQ